MLLSLLVAFSIATPVAAVTPTHTQSFTESPTPTLTLTSSATETATFSATPSPTLTETSTPTLSQTSTFTATASQTPTASPTFTSTPTVTPDVSPPAVTLVSVPAGLVEGMERWVFDSPVILQGSAVDSGSGLAQALLEQRNGNGDHVLSSPQLVSPAGDGSFSLQTPLINGINDFTLTATDALGNSASVSLVLRLVDAQAQAVLCEVGGGMFLDDRTKLTLPEGALAACDSVRIVSRSLAGLTLPKAPLQWIGKARQIDPPDRVLRLPAALEFPYDPADLDLDFDGSPDVAASDLKVLLWDGSTWLVIEPETVAAGSNLVFAEVPRFGLFVLAADTRAAPTEVKAYWTKNPFRAGKGEPTHLVLQLSAAATVSIGLYDVSGARVRELAKQVAKPRGQAVFAFDGYGDFGNRLGAGLYLVRLEIVWPDGSRHMERKPLGVLR